MTGRSRFYGARTAGSGQLAANPRLRPVRLQPGAFGNRRALVLYAQHCVWLLLPSHTLVKA